MGIEYSEFGPEKILEVYDPETGMRGYTTLFSTALGPAKGGIRFTKTLDKVEVFRLARAMAWKCALADLPFGGGKSGIIAPDRELKPGEKDELVAAFGRAIKPICPSLYVAAPDISMAEHEMEVLAKAVGSKKACTGKPTKMGGLPHELGSTGFGVYIAALVAMEHLGWDPKGKTFAVEGFGNVGWFAAKFLTEKGCKLVGVSDSKGTLYKPDGIDFEKLAKVKKEQRTVTKYPGGKVLSNEAVFELDVDLLIPAAIPDVITDKNANKIKAKMLSVGSNIAMVPETEEKLHKKGILVVPDFVANAGGVISSYVEYIGGTEKDMWKLVEEKIRKNTKLVLERAKKDGVKPRDAAMAIATERIRKAQVD